MPKIFISYRRTDSFATTDRIDEKLRARFGAESVFRDIIDTPPGLLFPDHFRQELSGSDVVLVIIGPSWLSATGEGGERRLWASGDYVRMEIEIALQSGKPVIPVTVENASLPKEQELPESIRQLALRHAHWVRPGNDFGHDFDDLCNRLCKLLNLSESKFCELLDPRESETRADESARLRREDVMLLYEWKSEKEKREAKGEFDRELAAIEGTWNDNRKRHRVRYTWYSIAGDPTWAGTAFWSMACLAVDAGLIIMGLDLFGNVRFFQWDWLSVESSAIENLGIGTRLIICLVFVAVLLTHAILRVSYYLHKYSSFLEARKEYESRRSAATRRYQDRLWRIQTR